LALRSGYPSDRAESRPRMPPSLGLVKLPYRRRVAGVGGDFLFGRHRAVAGLDDGVERFPLVGNVAFDSFDQVRN